MEAAGPPYYPAEADLLLTSLNIANVMEAAGLPPYYPAEADLFLTSLNIANVTDTCL